MGYHIRQDAAPYARPILPNVTVGRALPTPDSYAGKAAELLKKAQENHLWRQTQCINLIPSENTPSRAVRLLCGSDPAFRYAEHKKQKAFYDAEIFYYQGTRFIGEVEQLLAEEMKKYLGCTQVETRVTSGQMSNTAVFSALMLTNPNTVGIFDKNILKITEIVHRAGGLCYYDGANLNAILGVARPGDMYPSAIPARVPIR